MAEVQAMRGTQDDSTGTNILPRNQEFRPDANFWKAMMPLLVLAMMVSLDGTSVSVALPVSFKLRSGD
jgi:hypothetical protein